MKRMFAYLAMVALLSALTAAFAGEKGEWQGWVTDESCGAKKGFNNPGHASCAKRCIGSGKKAALAVAEDKTILLDVAKEKAEEFAGAHVKVTGTFDKEKNTIKVESIEKAK